MSVLICPVCKGTLKIGEKSCVCSNNHCYDIAKKGYINLLMSQKSSKKRHGDDKLMINARTDFLNKGYYNTLLQGVVDMAQKHYKYGVFLDLGCGDCFYTKRIKAAVNPHCSIGLDISKNALECCADVKDITKIVASISKIPVGDDTCGLVTNIFAPISSAEAARVLHKNGVLIRAVPLEKHLFSLKAAVYEKPYENATDDVHLDGFELIDKLEIKQNINIDNNDDIIKLFMMTPYYYKTSRADFERLYALNSLNTELEVNILVYKPNK